MAKYSFEFKKKIVQEYLNGEGSTKSLAREYGIPSDNTVLLWVNNYRKFGDKGLMRSRGKESYSFERKLAIVESYLTSEISYQDLALQEGISNPAMIAHWVNDFRAGGLDALRPQKKGRKPSMEKQNKSSEKSSSEEEHINISAEYVKALEKELLQLKIENAFLKELRRLRLEEEARMRERPESSAVSEENSN